jgi:hypothetical protein
MNWNTAVIVILGSVSCSLLCAADARYYRSPRRYGGYSSTQSKINKYSSYSSNKYGSHKSSRGGGGGHHHPYYMSQITYAPQSQVDLSSKIAQPIAKAVSRVPAKTGRITKRPVMVKVNPTTAVPARIVPRVNTSPSLEPRARPVERPQQFAALPPADDIQTNLINIGEAPVIQQRVLAPVPAVPNRPVQPVQATGRQAVVPPRLEVPATSNDLILPNMILEAIPAVPGLRK